MDVSDGLRHAVHDAKGDGVLRRHVVVPLDGVVDGGEGLVGVSAQGLDEAALRGLELTCNVEGQLAEGGASASSELSPS